MVTMTASRPAAASCSAIWQGCGYGGGGGDADEEAVIAGEIAAHARRRPRCPCRCWRRRGGRRRCGDDGGGHVLEAFEAVEGGVGLHGDAADVGVELAEAAGGAHEGAGGAEAGDEVGDLAFGLGPDFVGGGAVVGAPVFVVGVLVGVEVAVGLVGGELAGLADGAVGAVGGVGPDDLGSVGGEVCFCARGRRWRACRG